MDGYLTEIVDEPPVIARECQKTSQLFRRLWCRTITYFSNLIWVSFNSISPYYMTQKRDLLLIELRLNAANFKLQPLILKKTVLLRCSLKVELYMMTSSR